MHVRAFVTVAQDHPAGRWCTHFIGKESLGEPVSDKTKNRSQGPWHQVRGSFHGLRVYTSWLGTGQGRFRFCWGSELEGSSVHPPSVGLRERGSDKSTVIFICRRFPLLQNAASSSAGPRIRTSQGTRRALCSWWSQKHQLWRCVVKQPREISGEVARTMAKLLRNKLHSGVWRGCTGQMFSASTM